MACGRQFGKTLLAKLVLTAQALVTDIPREQENKVAYMAPTYKMLEGVWDEMKDMLSEVIAEKSEQQKSLKLVTGGVIDFWSLDNPDSVRGRRYRRVVIDEAAYIADPLTFSAVISPTLLFYHGTCLFLSTPRGRNWFWEAWMRGKDPAYADWVSFQMPTSANPFIDAKEIEMMRSSLPDRTFRQEYLAEFMGETGQVFRGWEGLKLASQQDEAIPGHTYFIGVDFGRDVDFSVFAVFDDTLKALVYLDRSNKVELLTQVDRLIALSNRFQPQAIWAESNAMGEGPVELLLRANLPVIPFNTGNKSKAIIIDNLALAFEQGLIQILNDRSDNAYVLYGELAAFEMNPLPSGLIRFSAPRSQHDDCVIALALAYYGSSSNTLVEVGYTRFGVTAR